MAADLDRSALTDRHMVSYTHPMLRLKEGAISGYGIPYFSPDGVPLTDISGTLLMWRIRLERPEFQRGVSKYDQPTNDVLQRYNLPGSLPYLHPVIHEPEFKSETVLICEGEKKSVTAMRYLGLPAIGIGGCWNWRSPLGPGVHPWILKVISTLQYKRVLIVPDGDLMRYDICNAYGTLAHELRQQGIDVGVVVPEGKIDDLCKVWGGQSRTQFDALKHIDPNELVQSGQSLIERYNLAFKTDAKDRKVAFQHTANITKLLTEHPAFPKIWRNTDNARIIVGDDPAEPDATEMRIANYFQHNLGFDKVDHHKIKACILALARENAKSPFLDRVRAHEWDGKLRLDTWTVRHWGVEDTPFNREVASKWLIAACARMAKPGTKIDWMFITIGPQATGKTSMPSILFPHNSLTLSGDHNDKDLKMLLHSALVVGFDELDSFNKKDASFLKAMVTTNEDMFRPPYGASIEAFPRRFTLYGCGNRHDFLQADPSGYRRYAIVRVNQLLDFKGLTDERDMLWAEAWHRYQNTPGRYWEVEGASENAEQFVIDNPLEEQILIRIEDMKRNRPEHRLKDGKIWFTAGDMATLLGYSPDRAPNSTVTRDIGTLLRKHCGEPTSSRTGPGNRPKSKWYII
jgi:hypothetical protein